MICFINFVSNILYIIWIIIILKCCLYFLNKYNYLYFSIKKIKIRNIILCVSYVTSASLLIAFAFVDIDSGLIAISPLL